MVTSSYPITIRENIVANYSPFIALHRDLAGEIINIELFKFKLENNFNQNIEYFEFIKDIIGWLYSYGLYNPFDKYNKFVNNNFLKKYPKIQFSLLSILKYLSPSTILLEVPLIEFFNKIALDERAYASVNNFEKMYFSTFQESNLNEYIGNLDETPIITFILPNYEPLSLTYGISIISFYTYLIGHYINETFKKREKIKVLLIRSSQNLNDDISFDLSSIFIFGVNPNTPYYYDLASIDQHKEIKEGIEDSFNEFTSIIKEKYSSIYKYYIKYYRENYLFNIFYRFYQALQTKRRFAPMLFGDFADIIKTFENTEEDVNNYFEKENNFSKTIEETVILYREMIKKSKELENENKKDNKQDYCVRESTFLLEKYIDKFLEIWKKSFNFKFKLEISDVSRYSSPSIAYYLFKKNNDKCSKKFEKMFKEVFPKIHERFVITPFYIWMSTGNVFQPNNISYQLFKRNVASSRTETSVLFIPIEGNFEYNILWDYISKPVEWLFDIIY